MTTTTLTNSYPRASNSIEKLVLNKWFWIFFTLISFSYPIYRSVNRKLPPPPPVLYKLPEFQLTNQFGKAFGSKDLKGKAYLANFIFTRCPTTCKEITKTMIKIQRRVRGLGTSVGIVSFTVDPEFDDAKVLYKYSRENKANPFVWTFLTGPRSEIKNVITHGFKLALGDKSNFEDIMDIAHSEKIAFVDDEGQIRGFYSIDNNSIDQLMIDLGILINLPKEKKI